MGKSHQPIYAIYFNLTIGIVMNIFELAIKEAFQAHHDNSTGLEYAVFPMNSVWSFDEDEFMDNVRVTITNRGGMILQYTTYSGNTVTKSCRIALDDIDIKSLRYHLINIIRIWDIHPENRHFLFNNITRALRLRMVW